MPEGGVTIYLREGTYRLTESFVLTEEDSGMPGREVRYQGYPGEEVRLCGSVRVNAEDFQVVSDSNTVARLRPQAVEHVRVIDLMEQGITEYGQLHTRGMGQDMIPMQMELTIEDEAYELASYPKTGYSHVGTVLDGRKEPGAIFQYTDDRAEAWTQAEDLWLYGYLENAYSDYYVGVSKVDSAAKTFTLRHETPRGVTEAPPFGGKHNKYRGYNLLEEIEAPGEYYIDRVHGRLYVWPKRELEPDSRVELSVLEEPLISMEGCHDIQLDSLILENTRGVGIHEDSCENIIIQNSVFRNIGIVAVNMGKGCAPKWREQPDTSPEAILKSRLVGDLKGYLWRYPAADRCAGFNNSILNCEIYQIGCGGIILDGGNRRQLIHGRNSVENCSFHQVNRVEKAYRGGVRFLGMGNMVSHCPFSGANHMTIDFGGNDNLLEYCDIGDSTWDCGDMGTIYHGVDPTYFGNVIRYNHIHDTGAKNHVLDIYNDGRGNGLTVEGNFIGKIQTSWSGRSVFVNGGQFNTVRGNCWYQTAVIYEFPPRWYDGKEFIMEILRDCQHWIQAMDIGGPLWRKRYPKLALLAGDCHELSYSPLNNVYTDSKVFETVEAMLTDPKVDANRFRQIGRYQ